MRLQDFADVHNGIRGSCVVVRRKMGKTDRCSGHLLITVICVQDDETDMTSRNVGEF
jgi:hypothetical protein